MPRMLPPIDKRFKKGQSGNPSGKPKQLITKDQVSAIIGRFCHLTKDGLQAIVSNPNSSMIEIMVASIMVKAVKDGDYSRLNFLFDRSTVGKVKEEIEHTVKNGYDLIMEDLKKLNEKK